MRELQLCPVCKEKFLVGLHQKTCMRKRPIEWLKYEATLLAIARNRKGRIELLEGLV